MQSTRTTLPKLHALGEQPITAPVRRAMRFFVEETLLGLGKQPLQFCTVADHPALWRSPGAKTTAQRPHLIIGVRVGSTDLLDPPFDAHLSLKARPEK